MSFKLPIDYFRLGSCIVLCEAVGVVGGLFTASSVSTWYATLARPSFNPPNWVFGPAWTLLYLLMGISLYIVWQHRGEMRKKRRAIILFLIQLGLNAAWSLIFFGLRSPLWAFADIMVLWVLILVTVVSFWKISRPAALLLIPYLLWVSFAAVLNYSIWNLNPAT
jgi:tryptophan-rich sensory protein